MNKIFKTDWLGSTPIFYNEKTKKISKNINDVIDFGNLEFDSEGLNNYLEFGFSVFGQTPVKNVKMLSHSSSIQKINNTLIIRKEDDPIFNFIGKNTNETEAFEKLGKKINEWEKKVHGEIVIPTSGGFDSRLLNFFIKDKKRIRSFSYGVSESQINSYEVVYARELSKKLKTKWQSVKLGEFHKYFNKWDEMFGPSTHAHGMYQIEFYSKIKKKVKNNLPLLSGIIGDAWAGSVNLKPINRVDDLLEIGYIHGVNADKSQSKLQSGSELKEQYFSENKENFKNERWMVVEAMRFKMVLLCYLVKVPEELGLSPWSPFLDIEVAMSMLCLPKERRLNRIWQKDFFRKNGLDFESMGFNASENNTLDLQAKDRIKLKPLDRGLLGEIVNESYIDWINNNINASSILMKIQRLSYGLFTNTLFGGILRFLGFKDKYDFVNKDIEAYNAYVVLKPLEELLKKRK